MLPAPQRRTRKNPKALPDRQVPVSATYIPTNSVAAVREVPGNNVRPPIYNSINGMVKTNSQRGAHGWCGIPDVARHQRPKIGLTRKRQLYFLF